MLHEKVTWGIDNFYKKIIRFAAPNTAERYLLSFPDWNKKTSRDVAQLGSVLAWGARGRRFKSCHPDEKNDTYIIIRKCLFFITSWYFNS